MAFSVEPLVPANAAAPSIPTRGEAGVAKAVVGAVSS
jgi:hypothetical protein